MAKAKKTGDGSVASYRVLTAVNHDGDRYEPGEPIELDADTAQPLLDVKAIEADAGQAVKK